LTFLRAIPFSLNILWRLALVFPFVIIALIAIGMVAGILVFFTSFASPMLALLIAVFFGVGASVFPVLVGTRLGLRARGASVRSSAAGMVLPAVGYGLFEALCALLILGLGVAAYLYATPLTLQDLTQLGQMDEGVAFQQLMAVDPAITLSIFWVGGLLLFGLRAALLVPFAGSSIGADPGGRPHTPFYGFGSEFLSLLALVIASYLVWGFSVLILVKIYDVLGYGEALTMAAAQMETVTEWGDLVNVMGPEIAVFLGLLVLLNLWGFSLQCAGGALAFLNHLAREAEAQEAFDMTMDAHLEELTQTTPQREIQPQDVMELVRSRMQQNKR
jgi:hypothetical protein